MTMNRFSYLLVLSFTQLVWSQLRGTPIGSAEAKTRSHGNERGSNERRLDPDEWVQQVAQSRIGIKRLLAVRVSSSVAGEYPSETLDEMEGAIFGSGPNPLHVPSQSTLTAQFRAVSHDQLIYEPAVFPNLTRAGLLEINIDRSMMMDDSDNTTEHFSVTVEPAIMAKAETVLGRPLWEIADRVMFCLPSGSLISTAAAISTVGGMFSYYQYSSCTNLYVMMHELGHGLNFHHSKLGAVEYGDLTGYMGGSQPNPRGSVVGYPRKAFNGHNHWVSGWFQDRALELDPSTDGSILERVVGFVDYRNEAMGDDDFVLLKAGSLYIQYNRAKDYNVDAPVPDRVTITQAFADGDFSYRMAALAQGETYTHPRFDQAGTALIVQVCTLVKKPTGVLDFALISIHLDDGWQQSSCPPNTGRKHAGSGKGVRITEFLEEFFQMSGPLLALFFAIFLVSMALTLCVCLHACYPFWRKGHNTRPEAAKSVAFEDDDGLADRSTTVLDEVVA